jgi:hypothetical protein
MIGGISYRGVPNPQGFAVTSCGFIEIEKDPRGLYNILLFTF